MKRGPDARASIHFRNFSTPSPTPQPLPPKDRGPPPPVSVLRWAGSAWRGGHAPRGFWAFERSPNPPPPHPGRTGGEKGGQPPPPKRPPTPPQFEKRREPQNRNNADDQDGSCSFPLVNRSDLRWAKERPQETSRGGKSLPNVSFVCRNCRG